MNHNYIRAFMLAVIFSLQTIGAAQVVFDASEDYLSDATEGNRSIAKKGITINGTDARLGTPDYYRFYANSTLTVSTNTGTIEKIVFNRYGSKGNALNTNITAPSTGEFSSKAADKAQWTGSASSVTFKIELVVWLASIEVTATGNTEGDDPVVISPADLSFSQTSVTATIGETFTPPTLNNPYNLPVTYNSSDENLAFVDVDGSVSIGTSEGSVTITAETEGDATHEAGSASYTITISKKAIVTTPDAYALVTSASALQAGDRIIIAAKRMNGANYKIGMSKTQKENYRDNCVVDYNQDKTISVREETAVFTLGGSPGAWTLKDDLGYLYAASSSNDYLRTKETADENAEATITITDGIALIRFNGSKTHNEMRYNANQGYFSCYNDTYHTEDIQLYKHVTMETCQFYISESGYATLCLDDEFIMPENVTGYTIADATGYLTYGQAFQTGDIVPARLPILVEGTEGYHVCYKPETGAAFSGTNLLKAATGSTVSESGYLYYKLAYKSATEKIVGFYWDSPDGTSISLPVGKAYLAVPQASAAKSYTFDNAVTALTLPRKPADGNRIFSLQGTDMGTNAQALRPGLYIVNGRKVVIR